MEIDVTISILYKSGVEKEHSFRIDGDLFESLMNYVEEIMSGNMVAGHASIPTAENKAVRINLKEIAEFAHTINNFEEVKQLVEEKQNETL